MKKFNGKYSDLKNVVRFSGIEGKWRALGGGQHQFVASAGGTLNFWKTTKTINFQGTPKAALKFERELDRARRHLGHVAAVINDWT
ncbi:MAG: hypothetical protein JWO15_1604 [Sphingomonadales bacterium]|nr:hypothetical protein [Sphingomonadales bacterium]